MDAGDRFWDIVCAYRQLMGVIIGFELTLLVLSLVTFWLSKPGTGAHVISLFNVALMAGAILFVGYFFQRC